MQNKLYLNYTDIEGYVLDIARQITSTTWKPEYIVGVARGGLLPANLISQYLKIPMYTLDVSLRDNDHSMGPESNCWMPEDVLNDKTNILLVDDINDTGATLNWIVDDWKSSCRPNSPEWKHVLGEHLRIASIVDNESSNFQDVTYSGMSINKADEDVWIVFPWEEWWIPNPK